MSWQDDAMIGQEISDLLWYKGEEEWRDLLEVKDGEDKKTI